MIAIVKKYNNQGTKLSIRDRDAKFHNLEHDDTVEIEIKKVVKKKGEQ